MKRQKPVKQMWDDTPHVYSMNKNPFVEELKPGTPLDRHRRRQKEKMPAQRCGACIGCSALLRCERKGGYQRAVEVIDIIRTGLMNEEMTLADALAEVREKKKVEQGEGGKKRRASTKLERRGSFLSRRRR